MRVNQRFSPILLAILALGGCSDEDKPPVASNQAAAPVAEAPATPAAPPAAPVTSEKLFGPEELDQMMAPLALYPDALLAQVLMASTYPGDVADAVAWSKANPKSKGDDAVRQVADQPWDPSVQSLVAFPDVLVTLGHDPTWVQKVGDAFLAQPSAVMDSVQRLRHKAKEAGNLESNEQMKVSEQPAAAAPEPAPAPAGSTTTVVQQPPAQNIIIESADPQVVYVPSYNPNEVYGTWPYPSYPPTYYPPPPGYYLGAGLAFGTGVAIVASLWGDCDWDNDDLDIDIDNYQNINSNREFNSNRNKWEHNAANRDGVPYRDRANRDRYQQRLDGAQQRDALRGRDPARAADRERVQAADRERARQELTQRGIEAPATSNREARDRAEAASRERVQSADRERARQELSQRGIQAPASSNREARARAQSADRDMSSRPQARQRTQSSPQARQQARSRQQASASRTRDNAFAGSRSPSRAKQQISRGQSSRAAASRPAASRASGSQVQRAPRASSRSSGGGGRRR